MALTDVEIRRAKAREKAYRLSDSGGMYLWVTPAGGKLWRWAYVYEGKEKLMSFGRYPDVSLAIARERHGDARRLLASGVDPMAQRKAEKTAERVASENSFANVASKWLEQWQHGKSRATWIQLGVGWMPTSFRALARVPSPRSRHQSWSRWSKPLRNAAPATSQSALRDDWADLSLRHRPWLCKAQPCQRNPPKRCSEDDTQGQLRPNRCQRAAKSAEADRGIPRNPCHPVGDQADGSNLCPYERTHRRKMGRV